ncbi:MAG: hypothetical protein CME66_09045 [Halobacteriovoraceae bacterium]|nr:hypothetical protein [Halobacteriovoraceae bacterium]
MKRYRVISSDFDTRAHFLSMEIKESWETKNKELHKANRERILTQLRDEFGTLHFDQKVKNFIDFGPYSMSVIAYHNKFFHHIRTSYVMGAYYTALTGVSSLGERILNHLILNLRTYHTSSPEYKRVYKKSSFDNWDLAIEVLTNWNVLLPEVTSLFKRLKVVRNKAIHFNPETDHNDKDLAFEAIKLLKEIIELQFCGFGNRPWFITNIPGEIYLKKEWEEKPFIKEVYLKNCLLVGPKHEVKSVIPFQIEDYEYLEKDISDEEFAALRIEKHGK